MRASLWSDDTTSCQTFDISHWEVPDCNSDEQDLCSQRLSDWKFFSQTVLDGGSGGSSGGRSRDRDSLSSLDSHRSDDKYSSSSSSSCRQSSCVSSSSSKVPSSPSKGDRYKTELCRPYEECGSCKYGDKCQFAHGKEELRNVMRHPKYKTDKCKTYYSTGFCPYGQRCHFIHDQQAPAQSDSSKLQKINNNRLVEQQLLITRQQQLQQLALLQLKQQQFKLPESTIPLPIQQNILGSSCRVVNSPAIPMNNDQLIEMLKRYLVLSTNSTGGIRPASLPLGEMLVHPASTTIMPPRDFPYMGSVGSTAVSSPTKSLPSSCFSPASSPTME